MKGRLEKLKETETVSDRPGAGQAPALRVISANGRQPRCPACPGGQPGPRRAPCWRPFAESRETFHSVNRP